MGTTVEKLNKVLKTKEAIRISINNKGGTLTESDTFSSYSTAIDNIQTGSGENPLQYIIDNQEGNGKPSCYYLFYYYKGTSLDSVLKSLDFSKVTSMSCMFSSCSSLTTIPLFDTSNVTDMNKMFYYCSKLTTIPLFDTSNVTDMQYTFYNCSKLTSIPQLDTSKVTYMDYMFSSCSSLTTIPQLDTSNVTTINSMFENCSNLTSIPQLNTSNVTNMQYTFHNCSKLTSIPQLDTSKVTYMDYMFGDCTSLEKIDITKLASGTSQTNNFAYSCKTLKTLIIRTMDTIPTLNSNAFTNCYHFYGTTNATYNPEGLKDGAIYVPDDKVEALKVATNWSVFADIIKPLSTLV